MCDGFRILLLIGVLVSWPVAAGEGPIEVTDELGRSVTLSRPAQRIVALAPHIVENVYSAGAGDRLVGAVSYSNYPPEAEQLPRVGSYKAASVEQILALQPDLVMMWESGSSRDTLRQLERMGIAVYVGEPNELEDVAEAIRHIGVLAGTETVAEQSAERYLERLAQLRATYSEAESVSVFYQVWNQPLQTLSGQHLISDVIRLCGGRNIYADAASIAPVVNMESLLDRNPAVIVASGMGEERPQWLDEWRDWPGLTAVRHDNLFFVPPDLIQRHTARILDGAALFCEHIDTARQRLAAAP
ncbi:cobalamin-binding protein [Marinimicrobium alkaliphilum]|uniref:cobalamin-binding protein n=1 Tax=Marinimicrobium alkaliphilum TaxID=2202654 RepID=UPI000DBA102E|nr:cobalamin-binding protein [Marinimicrobium alkaliphilum]